MVLAIASAILRPADVGTMLMLFAPMILLYELSIWLVALVSRSDRADEAAAA